MIDNMTKPLKNMLAGNKGLASSLKETRRELAEMGKTQKSVGEFRQMRTGLAATASQLNAARGRVTELAGSLRAFGPPSRQMIADFDKAKQSASRLSTEHEKQSARVKVLRDQLAGAGISTRSLSRDERDLRANMASASRNHRGPNGCDTPHANAAASLSIPSAMHFQNACFVSH
ncbi:hypothetical protein DFQ28_004619 [Apophysomyces sp. BC1034]|nr:hypothetical protein DFQ28_004619 [Apophysomyces sp. BC1034]